MNKKVFIFDWDGTLIDSQVKIVGCMRRAASDMALEALGDDTIKGIIGLGLPEAIRALYPSLDDRQVEHYRHLYSDYFVEADRQPCSFFPGALEVLDDLKRSDCFLAVATGKSRRGLDRALEQRKMGGFFDATRCADETASKPDPRMLVEILDELSLQPSDAVMIGDTEFDMAMARNAAIDGVAVTYGVHSVERLNLHNPVAYIDDLTNLLRYFSPRRDGSGFTVR